jgi:PPOX class probable F420-dependent enzyme
MPSCNRSIATLTSAADSNEADWIERMPIPKEIHNQRYIDLATFRKSGVAVHTPVWFAEDAGKLYFMTNGKMAKVKRIRNNSNATVASCTMRGKVTGPEFLARARVLPQEEFARVKQAIRNKYWLARLPFIWRRTDTAIEIELS